MASLRELNQRRVDRMGGKGMYEGANEEILGSKMSPSYSPEALGQPSEGDFPKPPGLGKYLSNAISSVVFGGGGVPGGMDLAAKAANTAGKVNTAARLAGATALTGGGAALLADNVVRGQAQTQTKARAATDTAVERALDGAQERTFGANSLREQLPSGYAVSKTASPNIVRVDGGRSPLFTNIDPVQAVSEMRGGTVNTIPASAMISANPQTSAAVSSALQAAAARGDWDAVQNYYQRNGGTWLGETKEQSQQAAYRKSLMDALQSRSRSTRTSAMQALTWMDKNNQDERARGLDREQTKSENALDRKSAERIAELQASSKGLSAPTGLKGPKEAASAAGALYGPERAPVVANDLEARRRDGIRRANERGDFELARQLATADIPEAAVKVDGDLGIARDVAASENMFNRGLRMLGQGGGIGAVLGGLATLVATRGRSGLRPILQGLLAGGLSGGTAGLGYGVSTGTKGITSNTPAYQLEGWTRGEDGTWVSPDGKASIPEAALRNPGLWSAITGFGGRDITPYLEALGYKR